MEDTKVETNENVERSESGNNWKSVLSIIVGVILVLLFFTKFVFPALDKDVDHSASSILEPTTERDYESLFGK